jgi:protein-S-isoprenylcysteine O-methyltransferase Ste14
MKLLFSTILLLLILMGITLRKVLQDMKDSDKLSGVSVTLVWVVYLLHLGLTIYVAGANILLIHIDKTIAFVIGVALILSGLGMLIAGIAQFRSIQRMSGTKTDRLVTGGIYKYSRNPQNVGWLLCLLGISILGRSGFALVLAGLFWVMFRIYLPYEEALLEKIYGDEYRRYQEKAPRYLGLPKH